MAPIKAQIAFVCLLSLVTGGCGPRRPGISLMEAAHKGDLEKVRSHLYWGSDANVSDREGWTPLHMAVAYGHKEVANAEPATTLEDTVKKIEALAAKARDAKDIIWLNCVNEKLTMVKGLSRIASQARQAAESGRPDLVAHSKEAIEICLEKARLLLSDAEQCTGEFETYIGSTKVEVQIDPDSPLDGPLVGDDPVVNGYTPAFRISSFDEPAGKTLLMVLFRNRIDAPDSLSQLLVKVDVKILLDQSGDKVVAAGEDRLVFKGEVGPGAHSVLLRLTYRCKRGRKSFRLKATSGHSPEVPAGKITLVEIISTLRDRPKPPAPSAADLVKMTP